MVVMCMNWSKGCFESVKYPELKRGQVIHSWSGMNGCYHTKSVLVSSAKNKWGTHYRAVNMETFEYTHPNAPLPMEAKKSLGSYFENGEILSEKDVIHYEKMALEKQKRDEIQLEHRENYSMGIGYYLGKHRYSGWQIRKEKFYHSQETEHYYEIAGKEDGFAIASGQDNSTCKTVN